MQELRLSFLSKPTDDQRPSWQDYKRIKVVEAVKIRLVNFQLRQRRIFNFDNVEVPFKGSNQGCVQATFTNHDSLYRENRCAYLQPQKSIGCSLYSKGSFFFDIPPDSRYIIPP